jgi:hypothetical protein
MTNTLKLVLTDRWFEEIKSGRKTHEYRRATRYWFRRLIDFPYTTNEVINIDKGIFPKKFDYVQFQKAYRKNPERMIFFIKKIMMINGENTDLHIDEPVYDIELGERVK